MLTKGAIGNLINRYRAVLTKCNLINTFGSLAVASMLVLGGAGVAEATVVLDDTVSASAEKIWNHTDYSADETKAFADMDMNGNDVTLETSDKAAVYANQKLNIFDSKNEASFKATSEQVTVMVTDVDHNIQAKKIEITSSGNNAIFAESGSLSLNADEVTLSAGLNAIQAQAGTVNIGTADDKAGKVTITSGNNAIRLAQNEAEANGNVSIYADELTITGKDNAIKSDCEGKLIINATKGTITGNIALRNGSDFTITLGEDSTINGRVTVGDENTKTDTTNTFTLNGGKFTGQSNIDNIGGAIFSRGTLTVDGVTFEKNVGYVGGAIGTTTTSQKATIKNSIFTENLAKGDGGALGIYKDFEITNATFTNNKAGYDANGNEVADKDRMGGGAIAIGSVGAGTISTISGTTFTGNEAAYNGGAIATRLAYNTDENDNPTGTNTDNSNGSLDIAATFIGNKAGKSGGAFYNTFYANDGVKVTGIFKENEAGAVGGAIYNDGAADTNGNGAVMTITSAEFTSNKANIGGAIGNSGTITIIGSTFNGNSAKNGGAINNSSRDNGMATITNSVFKNNMAYNGAAIFNGTNGTVTITDSVFENNIAKLTDADPLSRGGAITNAGSLTLAGTNTFAGNKLADDTLNDIYNAGTLNVEGDVVFDGGIVNAGTITGEGTLVFNSNEAAVTNETEAATVEGVKAEASGELNDSMTAEQRAAFDEKVEKMGLIFAGIKEGLVQGAVDANGVQKPSSTMKTSLELATSAPLAVNRILMNDIRKRMGDLRTNPSEYGAWARYEGGKLKGDGGLTNDFNTIQVGADKAIGDSFRLGAAFSYTYSDVAHATGDAEADTFMFSGYGIWMGQNGMFADVIVRVGTSDTNMTIKGFDTSIDTMTYSLSGEFGWRFDLCKQFYVEPQVELTYTYVDGDKFSIDTAKFDVDELNSLIGRAGVLAGWKFSENGDVYARASVLQEFAGDAEITGKNGSRASYKQDGEDTWFEYGIGANVKLTDSTYVWADVERTEGADIEEEWRGTVGVRFSF